MTENNRDDRENIIQRRFLEKLDHPWKTQPQRREQLDSILKKAEDVCKDPDVCKDSDKLIRAKAGKNLKCTLGLIALATGKPFHTEDKINAMLCSMSDDERKMWADPKKTPDVPITQILSVLEINIDEKVRVNDFRAMSEFFSLFINSSKDAQIQSATSATAAAVMSFAIVEYARKLANRANLVAWLAIVVSVLSIIPFDGLCRFFEWVIGANEVSKAELVDSDIKQMASSAPGPQVPQEGANSRVVAMDVISCQNCTSDAFAPQ